jgi:adenylate cyclase
MNANSEQNRRLSRLFPTPWYFNLVLSLVVGGVFAALAFTPAFRTGDARLYDLLLRLRPAVEEDERIVILDIDDESVRRQGEWPWRRSVVAEGLWLISEFAPRSVVLDLDYSDESPITVDPDAVDGSLAATVDTQLGAVARNLDQLQQAVQQERLPLEAAAPLLGDVLRQLNRSRNNLVADVRRTQIDNDEALANAVAANASVTLPFVLAPGPRGGASASSSSSLRERLRSRFALGEAAPSPERLPQPGRAVPPISPLLEATARAGFSNNRIDADGVTRSADLYATDGSAVFGHLVIPLYHEIADVRSVEARSGEFILEHPEGSTRVPRRNDGSVLINWPKATYLESFRHLSYLRILDAQQLEEDLAFNLRQMEQAGYLSYGEGRTTPLELQQLVQTTRRDMVENGNWNLLSEYRELKRAYLAVVGSFLNGPARSRMLEELEARRSQGEISTEQGSQLDALEEEVNRVFDETGRIYEALTRQRQTLEQRLADSLVFVGFSATSTTDLGVTPFDSTYVNLGVHAALLNTLLTASFLDEAPRWVAAVLAVVLSVLVAVLIRGRRPGAHVAIGVSVIAGAAAAAVAVFVSIGLYVPMLPMLASAVLVLSALTVVALIETERDKRWLHGAFEHYISAEFIDELVHHPEKLDLGGQEQELTAMFTDIRRFTGIAEQLGPTQLVSLLNRYLTEMTDVILDEGGTIDKFEGDAIVAFFGAPIELADHTRRSCDAALRMKRTEEELNVALMRDELAPQPLHTRIGINTGPMLVGNLGTMRRMDYTIMGHQANVASRLEGANKLYGTWILVSEKTQQLAGDAFIFRRLDRVRLQGVQEPVRLYQLLGYRGDETPILKEALEIFEDGLAAYEQARFEYATSRFAQVRKLYPDDGPALLFESRATEAAAEGITGADWDGVTSLQSK